jgi:predicted nucleotidyltransferase
MATVSEEVARYLEAVIAQVRDVFGDRVVGVYTTGSLALGDYRPGRSDIDLMVVVAGQRISIFVGNLHAGLTIECWPARRRAWSLSCTRWQPLAGRPWMPGTCSTSTREPPCRQ